MKTNRHQLEIAGDRIGQAAGALAKAISVLQKYGLTTEGAEVCKMVGQLGNVSVAISEKVKQVNNPQGFVEGAAAFAKKSEPQPAASSTTAAAAQPQPQASAAPTQAATSTTATATSAPKVETTADGDKVPA